MDYNDLKQFLNIKTNDRDAEIKGCYNEAIILVDTAIAKPFRPVPTEVRDRLIREVGATLYRRKNAPATGQYSEYDGGAVPVRTPRDPFYEVRSILAMYVVTFA